MEFNTYFYRNEFTLFAFIVHIVDSIAHQQRYFKNCRSKEKKQQTEKVKTHIDSVDAVQSLWYLLNRYTLNYVRTYQVNGNDYIEYLSIEDYDAAFIRHLIVLISN